jgi:hypothetical protein
MTYKPTLPHIPKPLREAHHRQLRDDAMLKRIEAMEIILTRMIEDVQRLTNELDKKNNDLNF